MTSFETRFLSYTHGMPCEYEVYLSDQLSKHLYNNIPIKIPCLWFFPPSQGNFKTWNQWIRLQNIFQAVDSMGVLFDLDQEDIGMYVDELDQHLTQIYKPFHKDNIKIAILPKDSYAGLKQLEGLGIFHKIFQIDLNAYSSDELETMVKHYIEDVNLWQ